MRSKLYIVVLSLLFVGAGISGSSQPDPPAGHLSVSQQHDYKPAPIVNDYPAELSGPKDTVEDIWGGYNRECTSWTAWKVRETFGNMPNWTATGTMLAPDAKRWPELARESGIPTGAAPRVHSVAISMAGKFGHAMWVERVADDQIIVSQYNLNNDGQYSVSAIPAAGLVYIYFHD